MTQHCHAQVFLRKTFEKCKENDIVLAINMGHDVSRCYNKAIKKS